MGSLFEELFDLNFSMGEDFPESVKYEMDKSKYLRIYEELMETLNEKQKVLLSEIKHYAWRLEVETGKTSFVEGIKRGIRIIIDAGK